MSQNDKTRQAQVVVIGAGPGGYAAAFAAADRGLKTILVNAEENPGGVCLLRGCIPSKALLHVAKLLHEAKEAEAWGIKFNKPKIDLDALRKFKNDVVAKNAGGVKQLAKARNVEYVQAWARFEDAKTLLLSSERGGEPDRGKVEFENVIIATGSRPTQIKAFDIGSDRVINSTGALELQDIPKSLLVVGGGYIGLEMGSVYAALGSKVSVVEMTDGLLPGADRDLVKVLEKRLKSDFADIHLSTKVAKLEEAGSGVKVTFESDGKSQNKTFDRVLISIGRAPNSEGLGLENTQVKVNDHGFIEVDRQLKTGEPGIYAIGDVVGQPMLAHKASYEAKIAAEVIAGEDAVFDARAIPAVVFTDPEIAWVGLTETEAKQQGIEVEVAKFPWGASGRATAMGRNDGLTKILVDPKTRVIRGVAIVGVGAGEMISEGALAVEMAARAEDVGYTIHPHPTLSETVMEGAELAFGTTTHIYRPPRK